MRLRNAVTLALLVAVAAQARPADAGHELPFYPAFYPQEIRIQTIPPQTAAPRLRDGSLHAYIGEDPLVGQELPKDIDGVVSLRSYVIATLDGPSSSRMDQAGRCALARKMAALVSRPVGEFTRYPYPVTPFHADYLYHADVVDALKREARGVTAPPPGVRLRARGRLAERLAAPWQATGPEWDATIEEVDVHGLIASGPWPGGWAPPWVKEGWFNAYQVLIDRTRDAAARETAKAIYARIVTGEYRGAVEKVTLERRLVRLLLDACEVVVLGYAVRREVFNTAFSSGIENVAFDSHSGLNSALFVRTGKLKDFIWNGSLRLGISTPPSAAWNPIGGFTDAFGRLVWAALGDPALLPAPYGAGWLENRVLVIVPEDRALLARLRKWFWARTGRGGLIPVPRRAMLPEVGTGHLRRVGGGKTARARLQYTVLTSAYHDGSAMTIADVLYPYMIAYTWSPGRADEGGREGAMERSSALLRERMVGFDVVRMNKEVKMIGDIKLTWDNPVLDVYLNTPVDGGPLQAASLAAPWSSVPWHVLALMDEARRRRIAAFSEAEARRSGVEWLDMGRSPIVKARLATLLDEFENRAYVPDPLKTYVTPDEARQRWRALNRFRQRFGHFLVTNGPYRLDRWTEELAVLTVVRDLSYPRGIGSFDRYPIPHWGYITEMTAAGGRLRIRADVEQVEKFMRSYRIVRSPLADTMLVGGYKVNPLCRYVAVGADGQVKAVGTATYAGAGTFTADLNAAPADLTAIAAAIIVDENSMLPDVRILRVGRP